ncbi:uncharacterized protein B0I36DRAFT_310184 [Microdochium trichocladiopsis]|uniref:Uncharacterized protein n=1 Tax=Microdochium trichocladiopsis TaxID=1682393 RepID=A0A9P9BVX8_9PEZI|nr:uncharacterized protein B0I36DRAFT_310184 [Microdochium trichocladiopsis]KAH7040212.1 hypothetical protein B0I36DRAFT_310184 [Microdochium trichocladiopsis]
MYVFLNIAHEPSTSLQQGPDQTAHIRLKLITVILSKPRSRPVVLLQPRITLSHIDPELRIAPWPSW